MEDRYEIRGKIGQGGLGAVYRGYDNRMNREVAIKRISAGGDDGELEEESTRQLIKEAGALASLQHPNIVTVYDVGSDEDGPYVVMELISGNTLDELIERAPLTWPDFRELAMQTQEALIAAQERNLIHSDIKPSNLMLTWLPSGKFQVKIVDFGLATLAQSQTKQDLETIDAVFGSIFFMPPEQFERAPLDARSDLYSMGCVYYQALTGIYPFDGTNGNEVMESHLQHKVKPIREVRAEIPVWVCDWIMWLLNRYPQDRPESARDALSVFLKNDRQPNPKMSLGLATPPSGPPRARLIIPGSDPQQAATPTTGPATQALAKAKMVQTSSVSTVASGTITQNAPQPLAPPEGFKPSVHTTPLDVAPAAPTQQGPAATKRVSQAPAPVKKPFKLGKNAKIGIGVALGISAIVLSGILLKLNREKRERESLIELVALADKPGTTEIPITKTTLQQLLNSVAKSTSDAEVRKISRALAIAKSTDGIDLDERIAAFITKGPELTAATREVLISEILAERKNPVIMPAMLEFASSTDDPALIVAALQAIRQAAGDDQLNIFLKMISSSPHERVRETATLNIEEILKRSDNTAGLLRELKSTQEATAKPELQRALQRLISFGESVRPREK
jgi:serine/threonine protein kinase